MDFLIMSLPLAAIVFCGVRLKRRPGMTLRADVCLWLTRVHLAVLALAVAGIIIECNTDFQLRWNITCNAMLLAWLTGIAAFFVGIRTDKNPECKIISAHILGFCNTFSADNILCHVFLQDILRYKRTLHGVY